MPILRKLILSSLLFSGLQAFAADEHNVVPGLTAAGAPLGLHGVDPVAFIQIGNRIAGSAEYTEVYDGVAYYFATEDNQDTFDDDPTDFLPENGGFCSEVVRNTIVKWRQLTCHLNPCEGAHWAIFWLLLTVRN